jgi:hypothetical protein
VGALIQPRAPTPIHHPGGSARSTRLGFTTPLRVSTSRLTTGYEAGVSGRAVHTSAAGTERRVVVVDLTNHCHRQFFGLRLADLRSASGVPTGVVFGIVQLIKILQRTYPDWCVQPVHSQPPFLRGGRLQQVSLLASCMARWSLSVVEGAQRWLRENETQETGSNTLSHVRRLG